MKYFFIPKGSWMKISFFEPFIGWTDYIETKTEEDGYLSEKFLQETNEDLSFCYFQTNEKNIIMVIEEDNVVEIKSQIP